MTALLTRDQAAEALGIALATLDNWRSQRRNPVYLKIGSTIKYRTQDAAKARQRLEPGHAHKAEAGRLGMGNVPSPPADECQPFAQSNASSDVRTGHVTMDGTRLLTVAG